ncbi:hypothetical protein M409DRAFT_35653 [Zasmidium cellare ATCC 36951]|uniref:AB hydrolase-1 domain-containing protein n=1 Tax=Zasmidium cellare ATCC 36951 TaxID=1080233 RepID=A0A6A6D2E6_ZASCE|nr:uncharacterized protein M409DRAFT_35653 [Zasmidium cellare ATCC 36951]KAF2172279.1 hypothetical protein M409DRAFT_35653 [Zasmidium cellare ATCC 36951]
MSTQQTAKTQYILASNGVTFAYRSLGSQIYSNIPLIMHMHFRANMDFWDPLLVNALAAKRTVILFDQAGVGRSNGNVATTYQGWADNVLALIDALKISRFDLLGFSMGGYTVQMVALTRPEAIRKLIICGSGPSRPIDGAGKGIVWPRDVPPETPIALLATAQSDDKEKIEKSITVSFFPDTKPGHLAAREYFERIYSRNASSAEDHKEPLHSLLSPQGTKEQRKAGIDWYKPNPQNSFHRLGELKMPVLILNGDDDVLIPTSQSWELLKGIENAQLIVYPKAGHGFLWQYADRVARDVGVFLDEDLDKVNARL